MKKQTLTLFSITLMFLISGTLFSTVSDYSFSANAGSYEQLSGGITLGTDANDEESFNAIPIGFYFTFNGQTYTTVSINSNGYLVMGSEAQNSHYALSEGLSNNVIAGMNGDLISLHDEVFTGSLSYKTTGTAPARCFTAQWKHYVRNQGLEGEDLNFQIKLYENSNLIEYHYGSGFAENVTEGSFVQVGLRGDNNADYNNRMTATDWSATESGIADSSGCKLSETVFPVQGLTFTWTPVYQNTPPNCAALVQPLNNSVNVSTFVSLVWQGTGGTPVTGFLVFCGTNNPPDNIVNGAITEQTEYIFSQALAVNTTYYWKVIPFNAAGDAENCPVWSFTTIADPATIVPTYIENLDSLNIGEVPQGWVVYDNNNDNRTWQGTEEPGYTGDVSLACEGNPNTDMNDWLVSPPVLMQHQVNYRFRVYARTTSAAAFGYLKIWWGNSQNPAVLAQTMNSTTWWVGQQYQLFEIMFAPDTTGIYFYALQAASEAEASFIVIDDIKIHKYNGAYFPPNNAVAITGNGFVTLNWNPPIEVITTGYKIYRNMELLTPDSFLETTYTDNTVVAGTEYTYNIEVSYIDPIGVAWSENLVVIPTGTNDDLSKVNITGITDNYPNPFNPSTTIKYSVAQEADVTIDIYNIRGQKVRNLVKERKSAASHNVIWNGKSDDGRNLSSGVYFCRMNAAGKNYTSKLLMLK